MPRNWMGLSLNPHVVEFAVDIAGCRVCGVSTLDKKSFPPTPEVSFSSTPLEALYSKHLQAPLGGITLRSIAQARSLLRQCSPSSPVAPEGVCSVCWLPPPAWKYSFGKMAAVSVYEAPVGGFSFDNCRRCGLARGQVQGGSRSAVSGSQLGCGLGQDVPTKGGQRGPAARGPCDSGESGPERGFLLRSGPLVHFPRAPGHPPSPSP